MKTSVIALTVLAVFALIWYLGRREANPAWEVQIVAPLLESHGFHFEGESVRKPPSPVQIRGASNFFRLPMSQEGHHTGAETFLRRFSTPTTKMHVVSERADMSPS
jgi:hypothetical protein